VRLLEEDPSLARWLTPVEVVEARRRSIVPVLRLPRGYWKPGDPGVSVRDHLGFFVLEGVLARHEKLLDSVTTELTGPGELLQPWTQERDNLLVPRTVSWSVMQPARLAVLGPSFVMAMSPWPHIRTALFERAMLRAARLSTHHALSQLSTVDARLLVLFWHLAERWGRVTAVQLSHEALGHLVGAKRPTVSLALRRLTAAGLVARRPDRSWLLQGSAEEALTRLHECTGSKATVRLYSASHPA
jgi:hypothetical protein